MTGTIQMIKPSENSPEYYISFYNMYNLLQINDTVVFNVFEEVTVKLQLTNEDFLENINTENYAEQLYELIKMTGVEPPENVIKMMGEDRGVDTSFTQSLLACDISPFDWFRKGNEFSHLYAIFEQALKDFFAQHENSKKAQQAELVNILLTWLGDNGKLIHFLETLEFKTFGLIGSADEVKAIWDYYTKVRNCISHSGGRITKKIVGGFNEIKSKHSATLSAVQNKDFLRLYFLLNEEDDYDLFHCKYSLQDIIQLDNKCLNFFRMFCVFIIESLAEAMNANGA